MHPNDIIWEFNFGLGTQNMVSPTINNFAWALRDGDVAPIPAPSALLLMGTGLLGLIGWQRWRTKND